MTFPNEPKRPWWLPPVGRIAAGWWVAVGAVLIVLDYASGTGPAQYPVLYVIPAVLAAWYSGVWPAVLLATAVPLFHVVFRLAAANADDNVGGLIASTTFRAAVIVCLALWIARLSEHERQMHRYLVKLEGLLPICAVCKSIRNENGAWEPLERFISSRSDADFSHGVCPVCLETHYRAG